MKKNHLLILVVTILSASFSYAQSFVPKDFVVPEVLENTYFRIRMLSINDVVKDYDAVMTSIDHLKRVYPTSSWPSRDLTFEQDLIDLGWHQKEFQRRSSFAYTVVSLDERQVVGCLYINPTTKTGYDATISMWVRASVVDKGYDKILFETVKQWVAKDWPFKKVAYPGRGISWEEWEALK